MKGLLAMFENGNNSPSGSPKNTPPPVPGDITRSRSYGKVKTKLVAVKLEDGRMGMADSSALERQTTGESGSSGSPVSPQKSGFGDSPMRKWERPELKGVQKDVVEEKKVETEFGQALLKSRTKEEEELSVPEAPSVSPSSLKPTIKDDVTTDPKPEPKPLKIDLKSVEIAPKTEEKPKSPRFNLKPVEVASKVEEKATSPKIALKPVEKKVEVVETPKVVEKVLPKEEPKEEPKEAPKEEPKVEEKKAEVKEPKPKVQEKEQKPKVQPAAKAQRPASKAEATTGRINKPKDITIPKIGTPRTPLIRSPVKDRSPTKETKPKLVAKAETSKPATTTRPARKNLTVPTSSASKSRGNSPAPSPLASPTKPPPKSPFFRPASQAAPRKKVTAPVEAPKPKKAPVPAAAAATKTRAHPAPVHSTKPLTKPAAPKLQNKAKIVIAHKADPKPEPKDVTKPAELHGSAFAPTASWVAKHGPDNVAKANAQPESLRPDSSAGRSPRRSLRRQNSSISDRSRSHPNVRSPSRRPATSVGKRSEGSPSSSHSVLSTDFLTRMSRPTQSSAAKVRDPSEIHTPSRGSSVKSLSPPRRQISPRPERTKDLNLQPLSFPGAAPEMPMDTAAFEVKDLQKAVQDVADEAAAKESLVEESAHEGSDNTPTMEPNKLSPPPSEDADDSAVDLSVVEEGARSPIKH